MAHALDKRILLVEDEALLAMHTKMQLEQYDYAVTTFATGEKAVEAVQAGADIDLILMDIDLGRGIDGTQAAEMILQEHDIPIVFLSSHTEPEVVEKTENITSYGYVVKSSSITVLDASIKMAFRLFETKRQLKEELCERERIEEALHASEEKFRALFEQGPIGVAYHEMVYDETGTAVDYRFIDANGSYVTLTGVDPRGKLATEAFPGLADDPADWIGTFGRVAKTGEQIRFERYLQPNDRWYDCVAYQVKPDHFVAAFVEITHRKRAEQAVLEQRNFAERLIETARTIILVLDTDGNIVRFNPYAAELLGYDLDEVTGKNWIKTFVPTHADSAVRTILQKTLEDGETLSHVNPIVVKGRRTLLIEWSNSALKDAHGNVIGVLATGIDHTAQENAEVERQLQNEILKHIGQAVIATDPDGKVIYWNRMAETVFGWSTEEAMDQNVIELTPTLQTREEASKIMSRIVQGEQWSGEFTVQRKGGSSFPIYVTNSPIFSDSGEFVGVVGISTDITERKRAENEIQKQLTEKETLLREIHHRVKNNIATIESFLSLQARLTEHEEVRSALQDGISRVQSMRVLYDKLLLSTDLHEVSMKSYAEDLISSLLTVADPEHTVTTATHITDFKIGTKQAFSLGIIINELLTNVFKYAFEFTNSGTVSVSIDKEASSVILTIQDNGVGFDERALKNESPGFGLTVVRTLVEETGGTYTISNDHGAKSVVRFEL